MSEPRSVYAELLTAERAVISACLMQPQRILEITGRLKPQHVVGKINAQILSTLATLAQDGRNPSVMAVLSALGDIEVEDGLSLRKYLMNLSKEAIEGAYVPWQDAVEVVIEQANRRQLAGIGGILSQRADAALSLNDLVSEASAQLDEIAVSLRKGRRFSYDAGGAGDGALARLDGEDRVYPTTGLKDLDKFIGGWPLGQLTVLAGRPGAGKSAVATSTLLKTAAQFPSLFFSLEMGKEQLGARMLTDLAYDHTRPILYEAILNRRIDDRDRRRLIDSNNKLGLLPIHIEEERGLTAAEIAARSRKQASAWLREGKQLKVIFIDHMMLVRASDRYSGNRVREVGEISETLTELAQELDVAVVALCQLNRQVEGRDNKRPALSDLRDSGEVEQNASLVIFLYRAAYYLEQTKYDNVDDENKRLDALEATRNKLEFIVAKNRNGRTGVVNAFVDIGANAVRNASFQTG